MNPDDIIYVSEFLKFENVFDTYCIKYSQNFIDVFITLDKIWVNELVKLIIILDF